MGDWINNVLKEVKIVSHDTDRVPSWFFIKELLTQDLVLRHYSDRVYRSLRDPRHYLYLLHRRDLV